MKKLVLPSATYLAKTRLQRLMLRQPTLGRIAKLVAVALIDRLNVKTGRLNPTRKTLADDLGMNSAWGVRAVQRALVELEQAGWFTRKLTRGAPWYQFSFDRLTKDGETKVSPLNGKRGDISHQMGRRFPQDGETKVSYGTEKNRELKDKGEASPAPLKRVSASPKNEKNGHQEKITQLREISDKAKAMLASIPMKRLPFETSRWKAGDPDPEPSPEEERALMQIVNGAEIIPMPKPKPAPIVLEPALLESRAIFPSTEAVT